MCRQSRTTFRQSILNTTGGKVLQMVAHFHQHADNVQTIYMLEATATTTTTCATTDRHSDRQSWIGRLLGQIDRLLLMDSCRNVPLRMTHALLEICAEVRTTSSQLCGAATPNAWALGQHL